jgi:hypothetical protein
MPASNIAPTNAELGDLLSDVADRFTNPAAHEDEGLVRLAATRLNELPDTKPILPRLTAELRHIAYASHDAGVRTALLALIGE